jgi:hypothetical protein
MEYLLNFISKNESLLELGPPTELKTLDRIEAALKVSLPGWLRELYLRYSYVHGPRGEVLIYGSAPSKDNGFLAWNLLWRDNIVFEDAPWEGNLILGDWGNVHMVYCSSTYPCLKVWSPSSEGLDSLDVYAGIYPKVYPQEVLNRWNGLIHKMEPRIFDPSSEKLEEE